MGIVWIKRIGIGFVSLFLLLAIYAFVMGLYFHLRKKRPYQKYMPEISAVIITVAISIVIKAVILGFFNNAEEVPLKPALVIIRAIYDSLGGLAFEGLSIDMNDIKGINEGAIVAVYSIYVGTTLLSALTFVSVITAKVSYEVYSRLRLIISRSLIVRFFAKPFVKELDTYIFTGLTKETLELAKSIAKQYKNNASSKNKCILSKKSKARIIFTGDDIPNFDRNNELCREVMEHNFLYISGRGNKQKSIAARLRLNSRNSQGRFVVFAFVADKYIPAEETNMDIVVSDVKARIIGSNPTKDGHFKDQLLIEYFILTKRDINYQAYQKMLEELKQEHCDQLPNYLGLYRYGKQGQREWNYKYWAKVFGLKGYAKKLLEFIDSKQQEEYNRQYIEKKISRNDYDKYMHVFEETVSLSVWNEASAIADSMTSFLNDKFASSNDQCVYVWSLGFGQTSQAICKELYVQTARIDDKGKASKFFVDAFDSNTKNIGGILAYEEPMSIYLSNDEYFFANNKGADIESIEKYEKERDGKIKWYVGIQNTITGYNNKKLEQEWEKEYQPFAVNLHDISCFDKNFLKSADGYTGLEKSVNHIPQYIVIATGDDYRNIRIVNAMVFDILNEKARNNTPSKPQVIFVNVWDDKNNDLINTYDIGEKVDASDKSYQFIKYCKDGKNSEESEPYLYVVILGNNDKIYSNAMLSYEDYAKYNEQYKKATKDLNEQGITEKEDIIYDRLEAEKFLQLTQDDIINIIRYTQEDIKTIKSYSTAILENGEYKKKYPHLTKTQIEIIHKLSLEQIQNLQKQANLSVYVQNQIQSKNLEKPEVAEESQQQGKISQFRIKIGLPPKKKKETKEQPKDKSELRNTWNALSLWEKKSNANVYFYSKVYNRAMDNFDRMDVAQQNSAFTRLLIQEHQRWMRLHFVHGWEYGATIKERRIHDCLCPYIFVDRSKCRYDMFNVMLRQSIGDKKSQTSGNNSEPNNTGQENSQDKNNNDDNHILH